MDEMSRRDYNKITKNKKIIREMNLKGGVGVNGMEMGYAYEPLVYGEKRNCPEWVSAEQFYNCENFSAVFEKSGFSLDRLFHRSGILDLSRI